MPDHWIPLVMVSEAEKWGKGETLGAAVLVVVPHTIITISIGTAVGLIGYHLSSDFEHETMIIASLILFVMGLIYIYKGYKSEQSHSSLVRTESKARKKTKGEFLERHGKSLTGIVLIVFGVLILLHLI